MTAFLVCHGAVLTPQGWIEEGYVWVQSGIIKAINAGNPPEEMLLLADQILEARNCAVLPGLINAHTHLSQTFMRGLAGGRPLINWLKEIIWPIQEVISPDEMYLAAALGLVENLRCGATYVVDHHKITAAPAYSNAVLQAAREVGLDFTLARSWLDRGKNPEDPAQILEDLERLFDQTREDQRIRAANGPIALWRCSGDTLRLTRELALKYDAVTHFHVSEILDEVQMSLDEYSLRPVQWLASIGVLGADTQVVHAVWVDDSEIELIAATRAPVIHCPVSNAVLGSGIAPVANMIERGIDVRLGTDGPASNDSQDIWETLKSALSFARASTLDPTVLPPHQALGLATGGRFLQEGEPANLIMVKLDHPGAVPVQDIDSTLVLCTRGGNVDTVMVAGEVLMRNGKVTILDEDSLVDECQKAITGLRKRAGITA
jgi:5-methylthioadenosine/S-adenosylhomocysteine deaminase